ncbi:MAG: pilus assembly protein TadG-related protein, partial [Acidimicrobiales bacterium]
MTFRSTQVPSKPAEDNEGGFILAQAALLLVPLMIFAAFATDIGSWYLKGQQVQRGADAAALAGVTFLPDVSAAEAEARATAARNGFLDATPGDNTDFETGPLPQIRVTAYGATGLEVEIRVDAPAFLGKLVVDSVAVERYGVAEYIQSVHLGNPTSGLGTGNIPEGTLGLPNDQMWLALTAYCSDHEQGDPFAVGYYDGPSYFNGHQTCGSSPNSVFPEATANPTFDPEAYVFVVEYQPGSPSVDIDVYEPGSGCGGSGSTGDGTWAPLLYFQVYGPSDTTDHRDFIANHTPTVVSYSWDACISNSANGDGWWPLLNNGATPSATGGYYYVVASTRNPSLPDPHPADNYWAESGQNSFSMRALRNGETQLCAYSSADPTCPQVYALDWLPLYRDIASSEEAFYLAEISEDHAGETLVVTFFDAAEGIDNLQFV